MKKYCLTECFKRKMSSLGENIVKGVLTLVVISLFTILAIAIFAGIGWAWLTFMYLPIEDPASVGLAVILSVAITTAIVYWGAGVGAGIVTGTTNFVKRKYEGEPFECSIFEECKEEKE